MPNSENARGPILQISGGFIEWLATLDCSLAVTTYQAGRLMMFGRKPDGTLRAHERMIENCKAVHSNGQTLWASSTHTLWRFENGLSAETTRPGGVDRLFLPREGRVTGKIDIHEIAKGDPAQFGGAPGLAPLFVSSAFNCIATISDTSSFQALWRPRFVTSRKGGDRCHLNGFAMDGTRAAIASATSTSDQLDGWRSERQSGGVLIDIATDELLATGLSMPHSPRMYDGKVWFLNSGTGELCIVDPANGHVTAVAFCPGFARGLCFVGRYAVIGLSLPRRNEIFEGLALDDKIAASNTSAMCGLQIVDIDTGQTMHWLRFEHTIEELFDIAVLSNIRQPECIGFVSEAVETHVTVTETAILPD